jgi:hypothetical protein
VKGEMILTVDGDIHQNLCDQSYTRGTIQKDLRRRGTYDELNSRHLALFPEDVGRKGEKMTHSKAGAKLAMGKILNPLALTLKL